MVDPEENQGIYVVSITDISELFVTLVFCINPGKYL